MISRRTAANLARILLVAPCAAFMLLQLAAQSPPQTSPATFDLDLDRQPLVSLDGPWRFHSGDDPAWANPDYDDSNWQLFYPLKSWSEQRFSGTAWFRAKIKVPANPGPLGLYLFYIDDSHQIFADGHLLLSAGGMPPHPRSYGIPPTILALPAHQPAGQPYTLNLAIRVWLDPRWAEYHPGGISPGSRIGTADLVQDAYATQITSWAWRSVSAILLAILETLAGITALALFAFRRKDLEYLWFALILFFSVATRCFYTWFQFHALPSHQFEGLFILLVTAANFAEIAFFYRLLRGKRSWLFWCAIAADSALVVSALLACFELIMLGTVSGLLVLLQVPSIVWKLTLLTRRVLQGFQDARLLIAPVTISSVAILILAARSTAFSLGWHLGPAEWIVHTLRWPFDISLNDIGATFFLAGMLAILILRFTRTRLHEETYAREREAARTVQQVLVPEDIPTTPGFQIRSVYHPFGEVGGDFFQVIPQPDGAVLIVIGDVSGKGMPAAMTVSLLVGTFRTLVHYTQSPGEILAAMNQRMLARSNGGFTTCLVLRADPGGKLTIANAGHIAPYLNGAEISIDNGLPLGLATEAAYPESEIEFPPEIQLLLMTDGVVEARSKSGQLFGFDRTAAIASQDAESIAQAAQNFGQDDDITVLTLTHLAS
jgi:hypothetical protein